MKNFITENAPVIFFAGERHSFLRFVKRGEKFSSHFGEVCYDDVIGLKYGASVKTHNGRVFYLLKPSLAELEKGVKRATTIMYPKDIGYMVLMGSIKPGSYVAEVGAGSGALTSVLASLVGETGKVFSFDRRKEFLNLCKKNMEKLGLEKRVVFFERDVSIEGFGDIEVDTLIVDVPAPWDIVKPGIDIIHGGGVWISLSPQIEQIVKTHRALSMSGFVRIEVVEMFLRKMKIRTVGTRPEERMVSHTGYILTANRIAIDNVR